MTISNPMVVPASKTKGLQMVGIAAVSPDQSYFKRRNVLPADILALTSFSDPIFRTALRVFGRGACTNEACPSHL
jgi:hypothetical protein